MAGSSAHRFAQVDQVIAVSIERPFYRFCAVMRYHALQQPEFLARLKTKLLEINKSIMADAHDWHPK